VTEEKDLGVIMQSDLKWDKQCSKSVKTANRILGMIKRSFYSLNKEVVLNLCKSLVRSHLEDSMQAWRPQLKKNFDLLEEFKEGHLSWLSHLKIKIMKKDCKV
jgi:hypothetical protein